MDDKQLLNLLLKEDTQSLLSTRDFEINESNDFEIIFKNIIIHKPWDVVFFAFYFLDHIENIDYQNWKKIIRDSLAQEDRYVRGSINLVDFFYKFVRIDFLWLYDSIDDLAKKKKEDVLDYYTGAPKLLLLGEEDIIRMLKFYNVNNRNLLEIQDKLQKIQHKLLLEGAMKAERLIIENYFLPSWCKKFFYHNKSNV